MRGTLAVICRPSLVAGFALAGVPTHPARDPEEAALRLRELAERPGQGLVLVEESLHRGPAAVEPGGGGRGEGLPVVMPFPGPVWELPEEPEAYVLELLRRAVGYRVKL